MKNEDFGLSGQAAVTTYLGVVLDDLSASFHMQCQNVDVRMLRHGTGTVIRYRKKRLWACSEMTVVAVFSFSSVKCTESSEVTTDDPGIV
jgi:hypothetical protein